MVESAQHPDSEQAPETIPTPPTFPISWLQPEDAQLHWTRDQMHFPGQLKTMDAEFLAALSSSGARSMAERYEMPVIVRTAAFNTYAYIAMAPRFQTPEELAAIEQRSLQAMGPAAASPLGLWEKEVLPEVKRQIAYFMGFDLSAMTNRGLSAHLAETMRRLPKIGELHFQIVFPMGRARDVFDETYRQLLPDEGPFAGTELLQGIDNISLRSDRAIWHLSRRVANTPAVRQVFESHPSSEVVPELNGSPEGRAFIAELQAYLDDFGHRPETWGLSRPSMIEDPTPAINGIKGYLRRPEFDPEATLARAAAERERRLVDIRERLQGYPYPVRLQFEQALKAGQEANVLSEDHNYWIDFRLPYEFRRVILEVGRRLTTAGAIDSPDDAFHLTFPELLETVEFLGSQIIDHHGTVAARKAELARFSTIQPPPVLGTTPPASSPGSPAERSEASFFDALPGPEGQPDVLDGAAGSPGIARGRACVIRWLSDAGKLRPGDILVAPTTAPAWTPFFATAAGIVTDTGGMLSHCAVVAREYGIPAVVGTAMASTMLRDGQMIEVDGNAGLVRIVSED